MIKEEELSSIFMLSEEKAFQDYLWFWLSVMVLSSLLFIYLIYV